MKEEGFYQEQSQLFVTLLRQRHNWMPWGFTMSGEKWLDERLKPIQEHHQKLRQTLSEQEEQLLSACGEDRFFKSGASDNGISIKMAKNTELPLSPGYFQFEFSNFLRTNARRIFPGHLRHLAAQTENLETLAFPTYESFIQGLGGVARTD